MKMSKAEAKSEVSPSMDAPEYPYGLCLRLGKDEIAKLGIKVPSIGDKFSISASAVVKSMSASSGEGGDYASIELQITDMDLDEDAETKTNKTAKKLFGGMSSKGPLGKTVFGEIPKKPAAF